MKQWLRRELKPMTERLLAPDWLAARGMGSPEETRRPDRLNTSPAEPTTHTVFSLMVFERWAEE